MSVVLISPASPSNSVWHLWQFCFLWALMPPPVKQGQGAGCDGLPGLSQEQCFHSGGCNTVLLKTDLGGIYSQWGHSYGNGIPERSAD